MTALRLHADRPRRRLALLGLAAVLGAMGCMPERPAAPRDAVASRFNGIDLTGAEWGRDFELQDSQGHTRTLADWRGRVVVLYFGFTQCPDACPTALTRAAAAMERLGTRADAVQVLFVTLDPERDTAPVMAEYTRAFHPRFIGLMADLARIERTANDFKVFYRKVPTGGSYTMDHSTLSYVYDRDGLPLPIPRYVERAAFDFVSEVGGDADGHVARSGRDRRFRETLFQIFRRNCAAEPILVFAAK